MKKNMFFFFLRKNLVGEGRTSFEKSLVRGSNFIFSFLKTTFQKIKK